MSPPAAALHGAITVYQWILRPLLGPHCRFHPHCSAYAKQALTIHGAARGSWLAAGRVLRCNPWHPGGDDPVPLRSQGPVSLHDPAPVPPGGNDFVPPGGNDPVPLGGNDPVPLGGNDPVPLGGNDPVPPDATSPQPAQKD